MQLPLAQPSSGISSHWLPPVGARATTKVTFKNGFSTEPAREAPWLSIEPHELMPGFRRVITSSLKMSVR